MPKTRLISPGSIPNHKLLKNLQLQGNYISNDGGDEGITVDDDGVVTASSQIDIGNMSLTTSELDISSGDLTIDVSSDLLIQVNNTVWFYGQNGTYKHLKIYTGIAGEATIWAHDGINYEKLITKGISLDLNASLGDIVFSAETTEVPQLLFDMDSTAGQIDIQLKVDGDDLSFKQYDGTEVLRLTDGGNVGIGVSDPDSLLEVFGESAQLKLSWDASNHAAITVADDGELELATTGTDANIILDAEGHVEFDNCAVGFDKLAGAFGTSQVLGGVNDSTDIDFRLSNKYELELTNNLDGIVISEFLNLIFPAVSGNFILVISQDGTGSQTIHHSAYVAYQSDGATKATNAAFADGTDGALRWAGGSTPTLTTTADKADIVAIYWDADNQTAFAVMSQNF